MNRTIVTVAAVFSASSLLLVDSAVKGTVLLVLATVVALFLRRDSAATRHLVWLLAIVAMLVVPLLSALLPQWRVLPAWASHSPKPAVVDVSPPAIVRSAEVAVELPRASTPVEVERPSSMAELSAAQLPESPVAIATPKINSESTVWSWNWINSLPLVWAIGCAVLMLRLSAARWMLWNSERLATVVWPAGVGHVSQRARAKVKVVSTLETCSTTHDPIVTALETICSQLGISRPVTLLIHPDKTIPVVWGILRCRLMLPAAARQWSDEQLRSVLLHELAHIKRRDTLVQLLAQVACALHWFNPLVWFAAWRLDVERERSCDDLVLASGVRPSAYAGHLLEVVTGLSPARWTQSSGLAMARKSSLEGRLTAVLGKDLNRRGVSVALAGLALVIAIGVAVPIAMLRAADEKRNPPQATLIAAVPPQELDQIAPPAAQPMHKDARSLYEIWQRHARGNGDIPGGLVGELAGGVRRFMRYNPTSKTVPTLNALLPRLDGTRDWKPADAIALLDEIAAIQNSPLSMVTSDEYDRVIVTGKPLPKELADKEWLWGKADASGLRIAWDLQPRNPRVQLSIEEGYLSPVRLGTALNGRLLVHNSGDKPVVLRVPTWYQGSVTAVDKDQKPIEIRGIEWLTLSSLVTHRLAPGDYVVIPAPGIGFGKDAGHGPWAGPRVGWNVMAKPGDRVPLTHKPVPFDGSEIGRREDRPFDDGPNWWPGFIKARFARELPLPAATAERTRLLERALRVLFDSAPSDEERDGFGKVSDEKSLAAFAEKLAQRPGIVSFAGSLAPARAWFNIGEADPNADKQPRVALGPGEYPLPSASAERGDAKLKIVGRPVGDRRTNDAQLIFEATEFTGARPPDPHKLEVPDGWGTWAIVCRPSDGYFYLLHKGSVRKIDYTAPRKVTDTPANDLPAEFRDEVKRQLDIHEISEAQQAEIFEKPAPPAATPAPKTGATQRPKGADVSAAGAKPPGANIVKVPDAEYGKDGFPLDELAGEGVMWNGEESGLSLGYRITGDEWRILGKEVKVELWVRNAGKEDVKFQILRRTDEGLRVKLKGKDGKEHLARMVPSDVPLFGMKQLLSAGQCIKVNDFSIGLLPPEQNARIGDELRFFVPPGWYQFVCEVKVPGFTATGGDRKQTVPGAGEWTGTISTRSLNVEVIAQDAPAPKPRVEHMRVRIRKDGEVSLERKKMSLDELKSRAARNAKKWFTIEADEDVPYAKVVEVVEALKTVGVTEFSFAEARVGDGKYRVANRTSANKLDDKHGFSMCRPSDHPQWFTVSWPAEGERPACWLRTYPNVSKQTEGKWAVVWEPGTNVLWWVDDSEVGKMTLTDPAHVIVDREGRTNNFSRDFGLPEEVKTEFRRLGFVIGRDKTPGRETAIGGNTGGQSIVSAEFGAWNVQGTVTDADGKPLADVSVRLTTNQVLKTEKTNAKGEYYAAFSLPLQLLAHWRGVTVEPMLEGFTERDMAKSGEFNVLLRAGEEPQRVRLADEKDFQPGPIPRFAERDLLPSQRGASPGKPGRADFVMLKTAK